MRKPLQISETPAGGAGAEVGRDAPLDRASALPLFVQIRQQLLADIRAWPEGDRRFPTDQQLAARFGVSKMTVRQALADLVKDGLLSRTRGRGTFVTDAALVERLTPSLDIDQQHRAAGRNVSVSVLSLAERPARAAEAASLGAAEGEPVMEIRRLRALGGGPAALDERIAPAAIARRAGFDPESAQGSIVGRLRRAVPLAKAEWRMTAERAGRERAALLLIDPDDPVLVRAMRYRDASGAVVMIGRTVHRSDRLACEIELDLADADADAG